MPEPATHPFSHGRPSFMTALGLLPPYELDDVKAAYHEKARQMHPDHGGNPADFIHLKEAYEHAMEYVTYHGSRRNWIAAHVERYLRQEEVISEVMRRGGRVEVERIDWMRQTLGEGFPLLAERLRHVYVRDLPDGDAFLKFVAERRAPYLVELDLAGSRVSSEGLKCLAGFEVLAWLDVSGTDVDYAAVESLSVLLPSMERINVKNTRIGWWGRQRLRRAHRRLRVLSETPQKISPGNEVMDSAAAAFQLKSWRP